MTNFITLIIIWGIVLLTVGPIAGHVLQSDCSQTDSKITLHIKIEEGSSGRSGKNRVLLVTTIDDGTQNGFDDFEILINNNTYNRDNPCLSNPCLHGSSCELTEDLLDYQCTGCPYLMGGKNCEKLVCDATCFRLNATVYYTDMDKTKSWDDAYTRCVDKGMSMVTIKDRSTHSFLRKSLLDLYLDRPNIYNAFWIGLNRSSNSSQWTWVDGTQLGDYQGWSKHKSPNQHCVIIENKIWDLFNMIDIDCGRDNQYFSLCQKTFPFLLDTQKTNSCQPNPCLHGSSCELTDDQLGYRCIDCPYPMGGIHCEDLECDTTCFLLNDTVYFLYLDESTNWLAAYRKCVDHNMTMAMLKDETTHRFLRLNLFNRYAEGESNKHSFWVGLNRTSATAPWTWVDGSELGDYRGWYDETPRKHHCAYISLKWHFKMDHFWCNNPHEIFTLCQKNIHSFSETENKL